MLFLIAALGILGLCAMLLVALLRVLADLVRTGLFSDPDTGTAGPAPDDASDCDIDSIRLNRPHEDLAAKP
jgi:hypothetical protein